MPRRTKIEVIFDILKSVQNKGGLIKPTHLLYKSNLSYQKLREYTKELMEKGMLEEQMKKDKRLFSITDKGNRYIEEYKKIKEFSDSFGL